MYKKVFAERIKQELELKEWTQKRLSYETDLAEITVSAFARGNRPTSLMSLVRIAYELGTTPEYMIGLSDEKEPTRVPPNGFDYRLFGKIVKREMKIHKYTQEILSNKCESNISAINTWLSGKTFPSLAKVIRVAEIFDVSLNYLLGFDIEKKREK